MSRPDVYNLIAADRGMPDGWRWFSLAAADGGTVVTGAVPLRLYASGKNKGRPDWRGAKHVATMIVTTSDYAAREAKWIAETGQCPKCDGGQEVYGCGSSGPMLRPCRRCSGTGKAVAS